MNPRPRPAPDVPPLPFPDDAMRGDGGTGSPSEPAHPWDHCPNCGARLVVHRSHYRCPRCAYFMSGSDFD